MLADRVPEAAKLASDCCFDVAKTKLKTNGLYNWDAKGIATWGLLGGFKNFIVEPSVCSLFEKSERSEDQTMTLSIYKQFFKNFIGGLIPKFTKSLTLSVFEDTQFKTGQFLTNACISASAKTCISIIINKLQLKRRILEALPELKDMTKTNNSKVNSI